MSFLDLRSVWLRWTLRESGARISWKMGDITVAGVDKRLRKEIIF